MIKLFFLIRIYFDYGIPKKVAFVKDHDYEFTTVKLFDKKMNVLFRRNV